MARASAGPSPGDTVAKILQGYADRAVFRGFARGPVRAGVAAFKMLWHRDRSFELLVDTRKRKLRFPVVLPEVPARSAMYAEFKEFVASKSDTSLPEHRRIDPRKARVSCANRAGNVSLTMTMRDRDYEYATRRLIHLVHETYIAFLPDGHFEYMVDAFNLDPDRP